MDARANFRVTEDRTYADVEDRAYEVEGNVRIAYPIELGASVVEAWSRALKIRDPPAVPSARTPHSFTP